MISEYHRPQNEKEALQLLSRVAPKTLALGGGTVLSKTKETLAVVDLQALGWNRIQLVEGQVHAGSCITLEALLFHFGADSALGRSIAIDAGKNIRDMATLGGSLVSNDGRSAFLTALLAADIKLILKPGDQMISIDKWLQERNSHKTGILISEIRFPNLPHIDFETVGRSPMDKPIICCSVALFDANRVRITFGGFGSQPVLAYDGDRRSDFFGGVERALAQAGDEWASAQYRLETGRLLAKRLVDKAA